MRQQHVHFWLADAAAAVFHPTLARFRQSAVAALLLSLAETAPAQTHAFTLHQHHLEHGHGKKLRKKPPKGFTDLQQTIEGSWASQPDGTVKITATVRRYAVRLREELDGSTFRWRRSEYNSEQPARNDRLGAHLRPLLNKPFVVHLNEKGKVLNESSLTAHTAERRHELERALDAEALVSIGLVLNFRMRVAEALRPLVQAGGRTALLQADTFLLQRDEPEQRIDTVASYIGRKGFFNPAREEVKIPISMAQMRDGQRDTLMVTGRDSAGIHLRWSGEAAQSSVNTFLDHSFPVGERTTWAGTATLSPSLQLTHRQQRLVRLSWTDDIKLYHTVEDRIDVVWKEPFRSR